MKTGYIFDMGVCRRMLPQVLCALVVASPTLLADPGDVESSHDYPGFPRETGYVITDYDEDNPAEFDFPVARPLPLDAAHVETVPVKGHRFVIRYEWSDGRVPTLFQTQSYYEKIAAADGFEVVKSGAVGDVTETFHRIRGARETWVYLEPAITVNVLTIMESSEPVPELPPRLVATPAAPSTLIPAPAPVVTPVVPPPAPVAVVVAPAPPVPTPPPLPVTVVAVVTPAPPPALLDPKGETLYADLSRDGRVIVPFVFQPGRDVLEASSQPVVDRVVAMMKNHPDLFLRIEGHTDNSGDAEDNMRLSARRAYAVRATLVEAEINPKRLDAVGVGGLQPLASNTTAEGREKNRRIELVMWKKYPAFHAPAPNGQNYYPGGGSESASVKPGD
jgi:outer membrane protein OmpA-like peptidoglycan-associated protein